MPDRQRAQNRTFGFAPNPDEKVVPPSSRKQTLPLD
jgi:hypothetical protein